MPSEFSIQPFQTQEEARAYRENMPIAMRSTVRGPVQGIASLTGMADIPALGERLLPPRLGGMGLGPKFWAPESEYKGYGESRQDYLENIGEAMVPGETVAGGVHGSQLLTELAGIGVIGKQAIDLIRKYGPLAVTKIKSIFESKPQTTVDAAVNEAMGMTRREVLQTGGAGIATLAVPGAAWKLGTAATKAPVAVKSAISFLNMVPPGAASRTATFKNLHLSDKSGGGIFPPNSYWNKDWGAKKEQVEKTRKFLQGSLGREHDPHVDDIMIATRPHFEKYGLEPNEITSLSTWNDLMVDSKLWAHGKPQQRSSKAIYDDLVEEAHSLGADLDELVGFHGAEDLGALWDTRLDYLVDKTKNPSMALKKLKRYSLHWATQGPTERRRIANLAKETDRYLGTVTLGEKSPSGVGRKVELFEIDGIPIVRSRRYGPDDRILFPNSKGMKRITEGEHPKLTEKPPLNEAEATARNDYIFENVETIMAKAVEETKAIPLPEKVQKIIDESSPGNTWKRLDAKRKAEGKAHGGIVDKAIVGGERYI